MKRKTFSSRLLAILMTVALVLSFASVSAFAEGDMALHKYEGDQQWTTITLDQEDQGFLLEHITEQLLITLLL